MDYEVPEYFKDEIMYGELSEIIENALLETSKTFLFYPQFKDLSFDEIVTSFKGYVCYKFLLEEDDIDRYLFIRTIKSSESELKLNRLIDEYISVVCFSQISDESIEESIKESKDEYLSVIRHVISDKYKTLSKNYDEEYRKLTIKAIKTYKTDIDPNILMMLTKCVIIESKENKDFNYGFGSTKDAVKYALNLYFEQKVTVEERKQEVLDAQDVINEISMILEQNELSR